MLWKPLLLRPARWAASQIRSRRRAEESSVDWQGESWTVRRVAGPSAGDRMYRCPGCDQVIASGVAHVVAWPAHGGVEDRRHWHTACWNARDRRSARVRRPRSAPEA
ncbi:ATP/GTP-binding protein [Streptomyces sp. NPDC093094]|uniref:ATP/GTP-binding protein n=1 Tax=Streptomyces sp. NPDC093094 TaxID=3366026 RepID=UPI0037F1E232